MSREVRVGSRILATDEDRELIVKQFISMEWAAERGYTGPNISAQYVERAGVDRNGNDVFANRGFLIENDNWVVLDY